MHKFTAKLALAVQFLAHLFYRVLFFWKHQQNLLRFQNNFRADGIFPMGKKERVLMPDLQRCQACSLCTFTCTAVIQGTAPAAFEPKYLMLGAGRSSHEGEFFLEEWVPCAECEECVVLCPNDVPVHAMAET